MIDRQNWGQGDAMRSLRGRQGGRLLCDGRVEGGEGERPSRTSRWTGRRGAMESRAEAERAAKCGRRRAAIAVTQLTWEFSCPFSGGGSSNAARYGIGGRAAVASASWRRRGRYGVWRRGAVERERERDRKLFEVLRYGKIKYRVQGLAWQGRIG